MVAFSGTLAGFGTIPSRSQTADPRHGPTSDRKEALGERFSMFSENRIPLLGSILSRECLLPAGTPPSHLPCVSE